MIIILKIISFQLLRKIILNMILKVKIIKLLQLLLNLLIGILFRKMDLEKLNIIDHRYSNMIIEKEIKQLISITNKILKLKLTIIN